MALYDEAVLTVSSQQQAAAAMVLAARAVAANTPVQLAAALQSEAQATARYQAGLASIEDAEEAAAAILRDHDPPTALLSAQNYFTVGAVKALRAVGRQREIAVIGYDDFLLADMLEPALTVIAHDPVEIGRAAAELLFRRLDGASPPREHVVLPTRLVERGSGEIRVRR